MLEKTNSERGIKTENIMYHQDILIVLYSYLGEDCYMRVNNWDITNRIMDLPEIWYYSEYI